MTLTTKLTSIDIWGMADAAAEIGKERKVGNYNETVMIMRPIRGCMPWLIIPEGFWAICTRFDKFVGILEPGYYTANPCFTEISHLVSQNYVVFNVPVKECPTQDNVMVEIDVSLVLSVKRDPKDVENFVYKLGVDGLDQLLQQEQQEVVRVLARQKKYSNIYDLMETEDMEINVPKEDSDDEEIEAIIQPGGPLLANPGSPGAVQMVVIKPVQAVITIPGAQAPAPYQPKPKTEITDVAAHMEKAKRSLNEKLHTYGIEIYSLTITNVQLPQHFRLQMEEATTFDSRNAKQRAAQVYQLKVIEDDERRQKEEQSMREDLEKSKSTNQQRVADEQKITNLYEADTSAMIAEILEKNTAEVREIDTVSALKVSVLNRERDVTLATINAQAEAEKSKLLNEAKAYIHRKTAEGRFEISKLNAQALMTISEAEGNASLSLVSKRDYDMKAARIGALKSMASNENLVITGTNKDNVLASMLGARDTAVSIGLNENSGR